MRSLPETVPPQLGSGPERWHHRRVTTELDQQAERLVARLHEYVAVARGVRAEFDAVSADLDPRIEAAAEAVGSDLAAFSDAFESEMGFLPVWDPAYSAAEPVAGPEAPGAADGFTLGLVVGVGESGDAERLSDVFDVMDDAAVALVERFQAEGFVVSEYLLTRGDQTLGGLAGTSMDEEEE